MKKNKVEKEDERFQLFIYAIYMYKYINLVSEASPIFADFKNIIFHF